MRRVLRAETRAHGRRVEVTQVQVAEPVNRDAATRAVTTPPRGPRHSTGSPPAMVTLELGMAHGFVGVLMVCRHESTRCQEGVVWRSDEGLRVFQGRTPKEDSPAACTCARSSCSHSARRQLRGLAGRGRSAIANFAGNPNFITTTTKTRKTQYTYGENEDRHKRNQLTGREGGCGSALRARNATIENPRNSY